MLIPVKLKRRWSQEQECFLLIIAHLWAASPGRTRGDKALGFWSKRFGGKSKSEPFEVHLLLIRIRPAPLLSLFSFPHCWGQANKDTGRGDKSRPSGQPNTHIVHMHKAAILQRQEEGSKGFAWTPCSPVALAATTSAGKAAIEKQINLKFVSVPHMGRVMLSDHSHPTPPQRFIIDKLVWQPIFLQVCRRAPGASGLCWGQGGGKGNIK